MPKEIVFVGPRQVEVQTYEDRSPGPREVKVRNLYSGISHGTEMSHYRSDAIWHQKLVEPNGFVTDGKSMSYPFTYGYEDVARVTAVGPGVTEVKAGDVVSCSAHHRETRIFNLDEAKLGSSTKGVTTHIFLNPLPPDDELEKYIFIALGTVALDGVLLAPVRLGESVVVVGQGVVGLLAMQLCKLSGADPVIVVDLLDNRLALAKKLGADYTLNPRDHDVGQEVNRILGGHGADICFDASGKRLSQLRGR